VLICREKTSRCRLLKRSQIAGKTRKSTTFGNVAKCANPALYPHGYGRCRCARACVPDAHARACAASAPACPCMHVCLPCLHAHTPTCTPCLPARSHVCPPLRAARASRAWVRACVACVHAWPGARKTGAPYARVCTWGIVPETMLFLSAESDLRHLTSSKRSSAERCRRH